MGLLPQLPESTVEAVDGRIRFVPAGPEPRWMRWTEIAFWPVFALMVVFIWTGDDEPGLAMKIATGLLVAGLFLVAASKLVRRGRGDRSVAPPTEAVVLDPDLTRELRALAGADRELEAIRLVRARLGVGLLDGKRIVDAAATL